MRSIEQLTEELLSLIQVVWMTEAKQRRDEVRDGSVQPISGGEAVAQVRQLIEPYGKETGILASIESLLSQG